MLTAVSFGISDLIHVSHPFSKTLLLYTLSCQLAVCVFGSKLLNVNYEEYILKGKKDVSVKVFTGASLKPFLFLESGTSRRKCRYCVHLRCGFRWNSVDDQVSYLY